VSRDGLEIPEPAVALVRLVVEAHRQLDRLRDLQAS
jgi:hypothetical protein